MITIYLGKVGSGKTASAVRDMYLNQNNRKTYSNIDTTLKNQINLTADMIIKREPIKTVKHRNGEVEELYKEVLNKEFWEGIKEPINVILDECHTIMNSRRSQKNIIITEWLSLIRRVLGSNDSELILISQLIFRIDVIAREMANLIKYHVCHYVKTCKDCGFNWRENSEMSEINSKCPSCHSMNLLKHQHYIEVWHFAGMDDFLAWNINHSSTFYRHYRINHIDDYFHLYSTYQWNNLFST